MSAGTVSSPEQGSANAAVSCDGVSKSFGGTPVLRDISLEFAVGTVNVLAGENGAGKSTLIKIIAGLLRPDAGTVTVDGAPLTRADPIAARALGVSFIPQELAPLPDMTVAQNLLLGRTSRTALGMVDRRSMTRTARELLDRFGLDLDPGMPMRHLNVATVQICEIAKAIGWDSRVVLMDEPTASISEQDTERLFDLVRGLRKHGVCIVYTTHRMAEIEAIADTVTVLRDGRFVSRGTVREMPQHDIVTAMIGREMGDMFPAMPPVPESGDPVLVVNGLQVEGAPEPISLSVRPGEIVGLAGLVGAGRSELLGAIFGSRAAKGEVRVAGHRVRLGIPYASIAAGIAFVPEDRKEAGLVLEMTVADNTVLPHMRRFLLGGVFVNRRRARSGVHEVSGRVQLTPGRENKPVRTLSGGNQQKVVFARWLLGDMKVMLLDEPTRGVDVGARAEIYRIVRSLAAQGVAILLASSEMDEVVNLSHRILVMREGRVVGSLDHDAGSDSERKERILRLAMGLPPSASSAATPLAPPTDPEARP